MPPSLPPPTGLFFLAAPFPPPAPPAPHRLTPAPTLHAPPCRSGLDLFDGFRVDVQQPLSQRFQVTHNAVLGSSMIPGGNHYTFGAVLASDSFMVNSRMDWNGRLSASGALPLSSRMLLKPAASLSQDAGTPSNLMVDLEYKGGDFSSQVLSFSLSRSPAPRVLMFLRVWRLTVWPPLGAVLAVRLARFTHAAAIQTHRDCFTLT